MNNSAASLPLMLKQLRLSEVRTHWATVAEKALNEHWSPQQYLAELCHVELANREDKRLTRYLKESVLPSGKPLGSFDFDAALTKTKGLRLEDALLKLDKYAVTILDDIGYRRKTMSKSRD